MIQLQIPYRSQWNEQDANDYDSDCGPTCVAMVLNYHGIASTPNQLYASYLTYKKKTEFTNTNEIILLLKKHGLDVGYRQASSRQEAMRKLKLNVDAGRQMIALVNYRPWRQVSVIGSNLFNGGHFVVVTGYDDQFVYIHDPLFGLWVKPASRGSHFAITTDDFCRGWGGFTSGHNPNYAYILVLSTLPDRQETPLQPSNPQPAPPASDPQPPTPDPQPPIPDPQPPTSSPQPPTPTSQNKMTDINRRIRALAAFRWAAEPDFGDETAVALWKKHLGDWGETYLEHIVQPGQSYTTLAQKYYGEPFRWPGIKTYNKIMHEGLWVGEKVLIPNLGQSGAHLNPALPSDEITFSKSIDLDNLVDPDETAVSYDDLWDDTVNLGYVEENEPSDNKET